ncbi:regulatory protein RecX [Simkania negevensis]|uniref:Regulatory protein RecX n=1 Tax=Simkania negevensis TaxID=83561 RepID=A0ABS3AR17_9BACT|nr:regulatory protein RecX [Simkania negevensis]
MTISNNDEHTEAFKYVLFLLSKAEYPAVKVRNKLKQRDVPQEIASQVITECEKKGYINDSRWLEQFVHSQAKRKKGPQWIRAKLASIGFQADKDELDALLEEYCSKEEQKEQIRSLLESRRGTTVDLNNPKERAKFVRKLTAKGYDLNTIFALINDETRKV